MNDEWLREVMDLSESMMPDQAEVLQKTVTRPPGSTATVTAWTPTGAVHRCRVSTPRAAPPEVLSAGVTAPPPERVVTFPRNTVIMAEARLRITPEVGPVYTVEVTERPAPASYRAVTLVRTKVVV